MYAVEINTLSFSYDHAKVLDNLDLTIKKGESLGLIGLNGSGKTTLFNLVCGLLKPETGSITILGENVVPSTFIKNIGYVFQNPDDQLFSLSVIEDISFGPINLNMDRDEAFAHAEQLLENIELSHLKDRNPHYLSVGEKRMISIAGVLSLDPEVIIFDEPSSNLDIKARRRLITYLNNLDKTKIIAGHDFEFLLETCSTIAILDKGRIVKHGDAKMILKDHDLMVHHNFEVPYSLRNCIDN